PYAAKLLRLPPFLAGGPADAATAEDVLDGLRLTGHFLRRDAWDPRRLAVPTSREVLERSLA
ncbi:hypothetical protein J8J40_23985, partial [Mycobacterium tuberculosis]|nr:hypothetical protein [Mycobacterium tuberculosis]MBP0650107.1 hypothetical protein [Mycobacterium tuberculosis]